MRAGSLPFIAASGLAFILAACQPPPLPRSPTQSSMHRHFALARDLRTFAVSAELDIIRTTAAQLAATEEAWGLPPGAGSYTDRIHAAAQRAAEADDLPAATTAVAELAAECGACHVANDVDLGRRFQVAEPLANGSPSRHMNRLSWVSRLLWDGLVGPSELTWRTGAGALSEAAGLPRAVAERVPQTDAGQAEGRLRALGEEAMLTTDPTQRTRLLAEVWGVCAGCHAVAFRRLPD